MKSLSSVYPLNASEHIYWILDLKDEMHLGQGHSPCIRICIFTFTSAIYVDADAGKCPTQPDNPQMWMKKFPGGAELPAFP
jgi:hypothetical protein